MDWKNPAEVLDWESARATRKKTLEAVWKQRWYPLLYGLPSDARMPQDRPPVVSLGVDHHQMAGESFQGRLQRLDHAPPGTPENDNYIPRMVAWDPDREEVIFSPAAKRATRDKKIKAGCLAQDGLGAKANRELACGLLGGEVVCTSGHHFRIGYECGNRYCVTCGPKGARKLFAQKHESLFQVAQRLLLCWDLNCKQCYRIRKEPGEHKTELPHWPPMPGEKPRMVIAKIDFTVKNTGQAAPELIRELNRCIRRFCRAIERLGWVENRQSYGLATCDELGGGNTNIHAHGVYVGPWLPQDKNKLQLSNLWAEITGYDGLLPRSMSGGKACRGTVRRRGRDSRTAHFRGGFILSIKPAKDFAEALYHAIKYPAKFAELAAPERLADLELIFHRVRRFHCFAAFYNPQVEKSEVICRSCPSCGSKLLDRGPWRLLSSAVLRSLKDLDAFALEMNRYKALKTPDRGPP